MVSGMSRMRCVNGKHICVMLDLPQVFTSSCEARQFVFTDGSCLFPTPSPSFGCLEARSYWLGQGHTKWSGLGLCLGLDQSSYRAEVLAICVAVGSFGKVTVFCDNSAVVRIAERLLRLHLRQRKQKQLPHEHRDLEEFFCDACVKAFARSAQYQALLEQVERNSVLAVRLADLHVGLARLFCSEPRVERMVPEPSFFEVVGRGSSTGEVDVSLWLHDGFTRKVTEWLSSLRWYPSSSGGWTAISALELLWQFIFDTGSLPPFWYEGRWRTADDHVLDGFVLPPVKSLYRVWVRL
eukprot:s840_g27.t1